MGFKQALFLVTCVLASVLITLFVDRHLLTPRQAEAPLTKEQSERILNQLTTIRQSLQRIESNQAQPARRPPARKTASVSTKGRPSLGDHDAGITVVEFTDYQCPFCSRFASTTFDKLKQDYIDNGKVRWVVLDMPLSFHKEAMAASSAAHCANEQGRFWEYRSLLYENQNKLQHEQLIDYAQQTGLDVDNFKQCLDSSSHRERIAIDQAIAEKEGITGTPTFVIGKTTTDVISGVRVVGAQSYSRFSKELDALLKQAAKT